jgi:TRAP-type C4-dicarboxylate transport system permease small subunit
VWGIDDHLPEQIRWACSPVSIVFLLQLSCFLLCACLVLTYTVGRGRHGTDGVPRQYVHACVCVVLCELTEEEDDQSSHASSDE